MANIYDNDILITQTNDNVFIHLDCGFGQPSITTIYLKRNDGTTVKLKYFKGNSSRRIIGSISTLKYNAIEIHTTINDIRDSDHEKLDISLNTMVYDHKLNFVDTSFVKKTKGKGSLFHSFYIVTIL